MWRQSSRACRAVDEVGEIDAAFGDDAEPGVVADDAGADAGLGQQLLGVVEVDAQPEHLGVPRPASDDPVHAVGVPGREVAGVQRIDVAAAREVGGALGVPEHDVGPAVDDLADVGLVPVADQLDVTARQRAADGVRPLEHLVRGERRDACGRLGLAVHHVQLVALGAAELGVVADAVGREASAGERHMAQVRQLLPGEADPVEQVERVRNAGECRDPVPRDGVPERSLDDRPVRQQQGGADGEVAVQHREAVRVRERQRGDGAVVGGDAQGLGDRIGVRLQVLCGEAHELGGAGRPGRAEQGGQVRVQVVR